MLKPALLSIMLHANEARKKKKKVKICLNRSVSGTEKPEETCMDLLAAESVNSAFTARLCLSVLQLLSRLLLLSLQRKSYRIKQWWLLEYLSHIYW